MLRFNILEVINKILGLVITAILSRILADSFGAYLYYQTVFSYLYATALFSSDYNFLVNYKINKTYIGSSAYYQAIFIKLSLVILVLLFSFIFLLPHFSQFAFWPYLLAITTTLFAYDFVLYIEDDKKNLIFFRLLSQITTLTGVLLFLFNYISVYYITLIQVIQTFTLTFGTLWATRKYLIKKFSYTDLITSVKKITPGVCFENATYFLLRNFIIFFTTIEIVILSQKDMPTERNIFAEGLRLCGILMPFALLYINFNINKVRKGYYSMITIMGISLLLLSPLYVLVFFGENFSVNTYFYNFFIWAFIFTAFLEKDYLELLTKDNNRKKKLVIFNSIYFILSGFLFIVLLYTNVPLIAIILFFSIKLLLYYLFLLKKFELQLRFIGVLSSFLGIHAINFILARTGYYETIFNYLINIKKQLL